MHRFTLTIAFLTLLAVPALAAPAVIQVKQGESRTAHNIRAETVSGILWDEALRRPGVRVKLWEVDVVRYSGQDMDQYNSIARQLEGRRGDQVIRNANLYLEGDMPEDFSENEWKYILLQCEYFVARGHGFNGDWETSIEGLESYIQKAEGMLYTGSGVYPSVSFESGVTGNTLRDAGGLNRYYLDALEALGMAYMRQGEPEQANAKGFAPLQALCESLNRASGGDKEYFDWAIRALRASASYAEEQEDYAGAREAYVMLNAVALRIDPRNPPRVAHEAHLKVGFMLIREGKLREARARFFEAVRNWESEHLDPDYDDLSRARPPERDWVDENTVYLTAGSYIGQGMVAAAEARNKKDWAEALERFSMGLSLFNADDELRSMGLLGAANACAKLAEQNENDGRVASMYAKLGGKYLSELTTLLPKSRAAEDDSIPGIQAAINKYENAE